MSDTAMFALLIPLGLLVGAYGALVGAGGGFILVPVLLLIYPDKSPETITSISLTAVFLNALSGSIAYARMKRIDFKSGIPFAIATIPGAIVGAMTTAFIPRRMFELVFGLFLAGIATFLFVKPSGGKKKASGSQSPGDDEFEYTFPPCRCALGGGASIIIGFLSSFLGIGGGIMHVPMMVYVLQFPVHFATATSQFILAITSLAGVGTHLFAGNLQEGLLQTIPISIGIVVGAQVGAQLSRRMQGPWIVRSLAIAMGAAGIRFVFAALA